MVRSVYVCWDYRAIARIVLLVHVCVSATAEQAYYDITRPVLCSPRKLSTSDCRGACQDLSICMTSNGLCCGTDTLTMQGKNTSLRMFLRTPYLFAFEKTSALPVYDEEHICEDMVYFPNPLQAHSSSQSCGPSSFTTNTKLCLGLAAGVR